MKVYRADNCTFFVRGGVTTFPTESLLLIAGARHNHGGWTFQPYLSASKHILKVALKINLKLKDASWVSFFSVKGCCPLIII